MQVFLVCSNDVDAMPVPQFHSMFQYAPSNNLIRPEYTKYKAINKI